MQRKNKGAINNHTYGRPCSKLPQQGICVYVHVSTQILNSCSLVLANIKILKTNRRDGSRSCKVISLYNSRLVGLPYQSSSGSFSCAM